MCGNPSSSAPPSSSGSSGRNTPPPRDPKSRRPDLRRFALAFLLAYLLTWPAWLALSPVYGSFLAGAANRVIPLVAGDHVPWAVSFSGRAFHVHSSGRPPLTGIRVDARSVHFNWLLLLPLLAGTAALGPGHLRPRSAALAILGLAALHVGFLVGLAEYRLLKGLGLHPRLAFGIFVFSQFYHSVGRIGLPVLIWAPIGLRSFLGAPAAAVPAASPAAAPAAPRRRRGRRGKA